MESRIIIHQTFITASFSNAGGLNVPPGCQSPTISFHPLGVGQSQDKHRRSIFIGNECETFDLQIIRLNANNRLKGKHTAKLTHTLFLKIGNNVPCTLENWHNPVIVHTATNLTTTTTTVSNAYNPTL